MNEFKSLIILCNLLNSFQTMLNEVFVTPGVTLPPVTAPVIASPAPQLPTYQPLPSPAPQPPAPQPPAPQPRPPQPPIRNVGTKLFIGGIRNGMSDAMLRGHFGQFGRVKYLHIPLSSEGRRRGFGYVTFDNSDQSSR